MKLPYAAVEFTTTGTPLDPAQVEAALEMLDRAQATDVIIVSHGWNNDMAAAERLYTALIDNLATVLPAGSDKKPAVIGVLWPSVRWADEDQLAGGGVALGDEQSALVAAIRAAVDDPARAQAMVSLTDSLQTPAGRAAFLRAAREQMGREAGSDEDGAPSALRVGDAESVFDQVRVALFEAADEDLPLAGPSGSGGAPGVAPDLLGDAEAAGAGLFGMSWLQLARTVLNTTTYYTMKARAGDVGANGVAPLIDRIKTEHPERRVHLVGHSFGARVVAAAATNITQPIDSVTLLQGAFSHYGFTADYAKTGKDGAFRGALANGLIRGPLVITHTHNDKAVRLAYAIASRLAGQAGAGLGDRGDYYGGIGANGSLGTNALDWTLGDPATTYSFAPGKVYNLQADATIKGHGDITNLAVVNALAQATGLAHAG